jgi:putative endonuclease
MPEPARPAGSGPSNKALGDSGERIVVAHLERLGWHVLATKFRCSAGEMDVIASEPVAEGAVIVFVEVKTRRGSAHGAPIEAVNARKRARLVAVAQVFLARHRESSQKAGEEPACRFDIAEVFVTPDGLARVQLRRGVFGAE